MITSDAVQTLYSLANDYDWIHRGSFRRTGRQEASFRKWAVSEMIDYLLNGGSDVNMVLETFMIDMMYYYSMAETTTAKRLFETALEIADEIQRSSIIS